MSKGSGIASAAERESRSEHLVLIVEDEFINLEMLTNMLEHEYDIIQALIDARKTQNITQRELSEKTGITQADISRIENGTRNPSLSMMKRLAEGLGMVLKLEFVKSDQLKTIKR